jgi:uroporphyrinogen III methyltransferase/synthase
MKKLGDLSGKKVLLPRAEKARKVIPDTLRSLGAVVDEVALYTTQKEKPENLAEVREKLADGEIDIVTFASSSAVDNFVELIGREEVAGLADKIIFAAIGPVTEETLKNYGIEAQIVSPVYTLESLAGAICDYFVVQGES